MTDQKILEDIAKNDSSNDVRLETIRKNDDESVLADVFNNDSDDDVRLYASKKYDANTIKEISFSRKFFSLELFTIGVTSSTIPYC